jgi:phage terminase large subunit-like protein
MCIRDSLNTPDQIEQINREFRSFPDGVHDDIVDAMAYGYIRLNKPKAVLKPRRRRK